MVATREIKKEDTEDPAESNEASAPFTSESEEDSDFIEERPKKRKGRKKSSGPRKAKKIDSNASPSSTSESVAKPFNRRRLVGRLANMMLMPTDVFTEVAYYLGPRDLLHIYRASKALHALLSSKSSKLIWRAAEEAAGLPECPPDLSSPQYVSLLFDTFCTICTKRRAFKVDVLFRARLCKRCSRNIGRGDNAPSYSKIRNLSKNAQRDVFDLVPVRAIRMNCPDTPTVYIPDFEAKFEQYSKLRGAAAKKKFVLERKAFCAQIKLGVEEIEEWIDQRQDDKREDRLAAKTSRRDSIFNNLMDLGYTEADFKTDNDEKEWKWKSLIDQPRELNDRIWNNIRPQLEDTIRLRKEKIRQNIMDSRRKKLAIVLNDFMVSPQGRRNIYVSAKEFFDLPLVTQEINKTGTCTDISNHDRSALWHQLLDISKLWIQKYEERCALMVLESRRKVELKSPGIKAEDTTEDIENVQQPDYASICQLAQSFFISLSGRLQTFDKLLEIAHTNYHHSVQRYRSLFNCSFESMLPSRASWSLADSIYKSVGVAARTKNEMEALGISFVCLRCDPLLRKAYSWFDLVEHFYDEIRKSQETENKRIKLKSSILYANDHDHESEVGPLAAYTGLKPGSDFKKDPEFGQWIKTCDCEHCSKSGRYMRCDECRSLEYYEVFYCQYKLDAHKRSKHPATT